MPQDTLTQTPDLTPDSQGRTPDQPDYDNPIVRVRDASKIDEVAQQAREQFVEPTLEEVGDEAQAMSDAGAEARMAHAVRTQSDKFQPLMDGSRLANRTARELATKATLTAGALTLASHVVGNGIDGFLDGLDEKHQQWQEQREEWEQEQRRDGIDVNLDTNKATIDLSKIEKDK